MSEDPTIRFVALLIVIGTIGFTGFCLMWLWLRATGRHMSIQPTKLLATGWATFFTVFTVLAGIMITAKFGRL